MVIPPAWAQTGCCPVCQAAKLSVRQTPGAPDQLTCAQCGCAFELEAGGSRLALTEGPPALVAAISQTARVWLSIAEVRALLQPSPTVVESVAAPKAAGNPTAATATPASPSPVTPTAAVRNARAAVPTELARCTEAELLQRADALLALGNSPLQIQVAFVQSGVAPELVQAVIDSMRQLAHKKRQQQLRRTWLLTGLVVACLIVAIGAGWALWPPARVNTPSAGETPRPSTPTGAAGFLLSLPTSVVQTEPPPASVGGTPPAGRCPSSPDEAATLFGGRAGDWTYKADAGGWIMTAITPQTIYVPAGMLAGYLQFGEGGANMNQVDGPAKIKNVNFIAVTCP